MNMMHTGVVKFFNVGRLYGFITDDKIGRDYFCHNSGLIDHIKKGDKVSFQIADSHKGIEAINVKLINDNLLNIQCNGAKRKSE
jgi:CspA family cold shock protein